MSPTAFDALCSHAGLAMARQLVHRNGGAVRYARSVGGGPVHYDVLARAHEQASAIGANHAILGPPLPRRSNNTLRRNRIPLERMPLTTPHAAAQRFARSCSCADSERIARPIASAMRCIAYALR